jgi:tetratricopeptide (TPR) repeat protein
VTRPEKRLYRHNRPRTATDPKALLAAVLSNLVSLNQNIYKIMSLATQISTRKQPSPGMFHLLFGAIPVPKVLVKPSFIPPHSARWLFALSFCFCCSTSVRLQAEETNSSANVRQEFEQKRTQYKTNPGDPKTAWEFGRSCFDLADLASTKSERANLAQQGIEACRKALASDSNAAPAHYYLALNQGQLARTRSLGALRLVTQMERELSNAIVLDPHFEHAGPDRTLGLLYRDAPSFGSIGSRSKANEHLQRAVELAPDFPDNRLCLLESYIKWGELDNARSELKATKEHWPRARSELSGVQWQADWLDWEARLDKAQKRLSESSKAVE